LKFDHTPKKERKKERKKDEERSPRQRHQQLCGSGCTVQRGRTIKTTRDEGGKQNLEGRGGKGRYRRDIRHWASRHGTASITTSAIHRLHVQASGTNPHNQPSSDAAIPYISKPSFTHLLQAGYSGYQRPAHTHTTFCFTTARRSAEMRVNPANTRVPMLLQFLRDNALFIYVDFTRHAR